MNRLKRWEFEYDERLAIALPRIYAEWDDLAASERELILAKWEIIRGQIPDRIVELERQINIEQARLSEEEDFKRSCEINSAIAELASCINDLNLWYRVHQELDMEKSHQ